MATSYGVNMGGYNSFINNPANRRSLNAYAQRLMASTPGNRLQRQVDAANAANTAREKEIRGLYGTMMGNLDGLGETERELIARNLTQRRASTNADMMRRGLYNTTVTGNRLDALNEQSDFQNQALNERLALQRNALLGDQARFVERIEDVQPNLGLYAQYAAMGGGGYGGGARRTPAARAATGVWGQISASYNDRARPGTPMTYGGYTPSPHSGTIRKSRPNVFVPKYASYQTALA